MDTERDPEDEWKRHPHPWTGTGWAGAPGPERHLHSGKFWKSFFRALAARTLVAAFLFAGVWGLFAMDEPWAVSGQTIVREGLTREMDLAAVAAWYRETFAGVPSFIPIFRNGTGEQEGEKSGNVLHAPLLDGVVVKPFPDLLNGIAMAANGGDRMVYAADTGRVMLVSDDGGTGVTVLIQHAGGRSTVYGQLQSATVAVNDWVEGGQRIGALPSPGGAALYFAMKEQGRYVDPMERIRLD